MSRNRKNPRKITVADADAGVGEGMNIGELISYTMLYSLDLMSQCARHSRKLKAD